MKPFLRTIVVMQLSLFSTLLLAASCVMVRAGPPLVSSRRNLDVNDDDSADSAVAMEDDVVERIGTYKMLAVRVTTTFGQEPQESLQEIEGSVFGTGAGAEPNSVVDQFLAVSHGQLRYLPADGTNGVVEIQMDQKIMYYSDAEQAMINATEALFGGAQLTTVADRILFCMPDGTLNEGVRGLAQFPGRFSYFHQGGCRKLALLMHELGHNLGFDHSGIAGDEYKDRSGYMGGSQSQTSLNLFTILCNWIFGEDADDRMLLKAYNGHKQWISGWFDDTKLAIDLTKSRRAFAMRLACFVDSDFSDDFALLRLDETLFLQYNCGKDYNVDTEVPNTVTVTRATSPAAISVRLASLRSGQSHNFPSFSDKNWSIKVCSVHRGDIDYAEISVHRVEERHLCANSARTGSRTAMIWTLVAGCVVLASMILGAVLGVEYFWAICLCSTCQTGSTKSSKTKVRPSMKHPGKVRDERKTPKRLPKESTC